MNKWVFELVYKLGIKFRNKSLFERKKFLELSDSWSINELEELQLKSLKSLVQFAYQHSPYYTTLLNSIGINGSEINSLEDLKKIPITSKKDLIKHNRSIIPDRKFKGAKVIETSGTSGESLKFIKDEKWDSANRAALFRYYDWYGIKPWERNGYFWGYNIQKSKVIKTRIEDILQNRFRMFSYEDKAIIEFAKKLQSATFLHGYSSMIYEVAKAVNSLGLSNKYNLKLIKGTSEKIYDSYQEEVKKAFGRKIVSEYGAGESGLIAFECPEGGKMHINMQNVILEEVDGQSVVTNLLSYSFPIIRYRLGDYIKLASKDYKCTCGRNHYVLEDVLGRVGKLIYGKKNKYPSLTLYYVAKNIYFQDNILLNYQAIQKEKGYLLLKIEQNEPEHLDKINTEIKKYFKDDLDVEVVFNQRLHTMEGKLKDFISAIE